MELLFEEFFRKILNFVNNNEFPVRWILKIFIYGFLLAILFYILFSAYRGDYFPLFFLTGLVFLAELAHYIRKSREPVLNSGNNTKKILFGQGKSKNKNLLGISKPKNKNLLNNKR